MLCVIKDIRDKEKYCFKFYISKHNKTSHANYFVPSYSRVGEKEGMGVSS